MEQLSNKLIFYILLGVLFLFLIKYAIPIREGRAAGAGRQIKIKTPPAKKANPVAKAVAKAAAGAAVAKAAGAGAAVAKAAGAGAAGGGEKAEPDNCPKPADPKYGERIVVELNKRIAKQNNDLSKLEEQIKSIDARYPVLFQIGDVKVMAKKQPSLTINGSVKTPVLNFNIPLAPDGIRGGQGDQGIPGTGKIGPVGVQGESGYWGMEGTDGPLFT